MNREFTAKQVRTFKNFQKPYLLLTNDASDVYDFKAIFIVRKIKSVVTLDGQLMSLLDYVIMDDEEKFCYGFWISVK